MTNVTTTELREMTDGQLLAHLRRFPYKSQYRNADAYAYAEYRLALIRGARYAQTGNVKAFFIL